MPLAAVGESISVWIGDRKILEVKDASFRSGLVGCGTMRASRTLYGPFSVEER